MSTAFISQYIRILYPSILKYKNGILTTDMDMIPMNSKYYIDNIKDIDNNKFIYYRDWFCKKSNQIAICYNIASPMIWKEIFNINSLTDIVNKLKDVYSNIKYSDEHGGLGWTTDQKNLYRQIINWNNKTNRFIHLNDKNTGYNRLDRLDFKKLNEKIINKIKNGFYSDFHMFRPYLKFKEINDKIVELLPNNDFISGEKITDLCDVAIYAKNEYYNKTNIIIYANNEITNDIKCIIDNSYSFFVKVDWLKYFQSSILPIISKKFILVSHNGDTTVGTTIYKKILENKYLVKWYGQNMIPHERTEGIPIGLENKCWKGSNYNICIQKKNNKKEKLVYINFELHNKKRNEIYNSLKDKEFLMNKKCVWNEYIRQLSKHKFCISPPGNGIDCHRTWEALYVDCIPIVEKNDVLYNNFKDLPILFVDNYNIITKEYLEEAYLDFKEKIFCLDKTKLSYWYEKISNN